MNKNQFCFLLGGVFLLSASTTVFAVEVPAVSGPAFKIKMGEVWKSKRLSNVGEIIAVATRLDVETETLSRSNGCGATNSAEDR